MDGSKKSGSTLSSATTWVAGLAAGATLFTPFEVLGQSADSEVLTLDKITIEGAGAGQINTNKAETKLSRMPGTVKETPQVINVVPEKILQEQNVTTLEQALRNVPGITASIGEGNGGPNGDRFRIRGFEALGDNYRDGLRDFGVYVRDSFNFEEVQVLKGPSSESFGAGSTGGVISTISKEAKLEDFVRTEASGGNGPLYRGTLDVNRQINETSAFRFNAMGNKQDILDRDTVKSDRWGVAGSLGLGIGTDTSWFLDYVHQSNNRTPDFGQPMVTRSATDVRRPVAEFGVPRNYYYGKDSDIDKSNVDMLTSRFSTEANDWLTIKNDTRISRYDRYISVSPANCDLACGIDFFAGNDPILAYGAGGGTSYDQTAWGIQNVSTGIAEFNLGSLRNQAVFGIDIGYQNDKRDGLRYTSAKGPLPSIWNPNHDSSSYQLEKNPANIKESNSINVGLFASDRVWLTEQFSVTGGVRWDYFKSKYDLTSATGVAESKADTNFFSPKLSAQWEPTKDQTYYVAYSTAMNIPFGQSIASDTNPINSALSSLKPERTDSYEIGSKIDFLDGRVGVTGALFQVQKNNAFYVNADGNTVATGEKQRVRGVELGLTGQVTDNWDVMATYTYMTSKVLSASSAALIGNPVAGVPTNSATLWTTYNLAPHFDVLADTKLLVGGGLTYREGMNIRSDKLAAIPYSLSLDAMVSFEKDNWKVSLNGYNLSNRINYDTYFQGSSADSARAIPSSGRSFIVNVATTF